MKSNRSELLTVLTIFDEKPCVYDVPFNDEHCDTAKLHTAYSAAFASVAFPHRRFRFAPAKELSRSTDLSLFRAMASRYLKAEPTGKPFSSSSKCVAAMAQW